MPKFLSQRAAWRLQRCNFEDCCDASFDSVVRCRPGRYADPHGGAAVPDCAATPAFSACLDAGNYSACRFIITERNKDLVENNLIEDVVAGCLETRRKC